jgi:hypothetical protein
MSHKGDQMDIDEDGKPMNFTPDSDTELRGAFGVSRQKNTLGYALVIPKFLDYHHYHDDYKTDC